ncbi:Putative MerR family transcriptional regulator [Hoyosella subflava DQS3-9A1]|uniref:Putative MerR family transcriptional regulator n=1 Tax=Hoyosella subflava (strain DSM 45089 / JCM 17490 / NBRC 109087 / DQS3-9A1) TaxID=443218 RepID=F6EI77_HOYSD|nr:Putative MerR family transcriptional regulator [Hoyosella subflava DQS3-9A1]
MQQIRVLEHHGVLPPAVRTVSGYRKFSGVHVQAALAYRALALAAGPVEAKRIMRAAHASTTSAVLALIDVVHARLAAEREGLRLAQQAASAISEEPLEDPRPADAMSISELAEAIGVRASTLRHWESEGLVTPTRTRQRARTYRPADVRDARIVHQLREGGFRIPVLKTLMPQLRHHRGWDQVSGALAAREATLTSRSRHLMRASAVLDGLLEPS